jgi:hypothetical protein
MTIFKNVIAFFAKGSVYHLHLVNGLAKYTKAIEALHTLQKLNLA